eukprot:434971_1
MNNKISSTLSIFVISLLIYNTSQTMATNCSEPSDIFQSPSFGLINCQDICFDTTDPRATQFNGIYRWTKFDEITNASAHFCEHCDFGNGVYLFLWTFWGGEKYWMIGANATIPYGSVSCLTYADTLSPDYVWNVESCTYWEVFDYDEDSWVYSDLLNVGYCQGKGYNCHHSGYHLNCENVCDDPFENSVFHWNNDSFYVCESCNDGNGSYLMPELQQDGDMFWLVGPTPNVSSPIWGYCYIGTNLSSNYVWDVSHCNAWYLWDSGTVEWVYTPDLRFHQCIPELPPINISTLTISANFSCGSSIMIQ